MAPKERIIYKMFDYVQIVCLLYSDKKKEEKVRHLKIFMNALFWSKMAFDFFFFVRLYSSSEHEMNTNFMMAY